MKYIRKITSLLITVVIIASIAIGIGVIFAVRNVNVTMQSYLYDTDSGGAKNEISAYRTLVLSRVRGTMLIFVDEEDVSAALDGSKYTLESFEKKYPCTINITIRERKEAYCVQSGEGYLFYDENGAYLRTAFDDYLNPVDNAPNVLITGAQEDEEFVEVAQMGELFGKNFAPLRSTVESIDLEKSHSQYAKSRITFNLRCGLCVEIQDYENLPAEKIAMAYTVFSRLSGEEKLNGKIYSFVTADKVDATYDRNA